MSFNTLVNRFVSQNLPLIISSLLLIIINIVLTLQPLTNLLNYESSAINGIVLSLIAGFYFLGREKDKNLFYKIKEMLILSLIPIVILSVSTLLCQKCPLGDGLLFYFVISVPSIFIGLYLANIANVNSKRFRYVIFSLIWLIVLLGFLPELYFNPQIYFYNPIFGYYPGVIYDQNIEITFELILYRTINLLIASSIIYILASTKYLSKKKQLIIITVISAFYIISHFVKPHFNFSTDLNRITSELKGRIETKNFIIIFPDTLSDREKEILQIEHEYYYSSIEQKLETKTNGKVYSIIFGSGAQKKRLFGSANADVAKPWLNQIYLNYDRYRRNLKHEIIHIFSAEYGEGIFKIPSNYNPGLIEGFAVALENNYDSYNIHYLASLANRNGFNISLNSLFSNLSFFSNASSLSYIYAGSFLKFLADSYGWENIKQLYNGTPFTNVFNESVSKLEAKYYDFLNKIEINEKEHAANYYFGRKPLIKRYCARATAKDLRIGNELIKEKRFKEASEKFLNIYNYSGTYSALIGYVRSSKELEDKSKIIEFLTKEIEKFNGTSSYYYLEFLLAEILAKNGEFENAIKYYQNLIDQNPHRTYLRNAIINRTLMQTNNSLLLDYINEPKEREKITYDLCVGKPTDINIQHFLNVLDIEDHESNATIDMVTSLIDSFNPNSDTFFLLSKFAYNYLDFESSLKYARKALINSEYKRKDAIEDHISKLEWIERNNY